MMARVSLRVSYQDEQATLVALDADRFAQITGKPTARRAPLDDAITAVMQDAGFALLQRTHDRADDTRTAYGEGRLDVALAEALSQAFQINGCETILGVTPDPPADFALNA